MILLPCYLPWLPSCPFLRRSRLWPCICHTINKIQWKVQRTIIISWVELSSVELCRGEERRGSVGWVKGRPYRIKTVVSFWWEAGISMSENVWIQQQPHKSCTTRISTHSPLSRLSWPCYVTGPRWLSDLLAWPTSCELTGTVLTRIEWGGGGRSVCNGCLHFTGKSLCVAAMCCHSESFLYFRGGYDQVCVCLCYVGHKKNTVSSMTNTERRWAMVVVVTLVALVATRLVAAEDQSHFHSTPKGLHLANCWRL